MNTNTANIFITATDQTRQAMSSISGSLTKLGGVIAGVVATAGGLSLINDSLEKFASLQDFGDNFDIGADKALAYIDALGLAGIEQGELIKTFTSLSDKIQDGLVNADTANLFKQLGVDAKDLKNEKVDVIFDKIRESLGNVEDKTKAVALAKKMFGNEGAKILASSQDEELKAVEERLKNMTDETNILSSNADEFYKNLDRIKTIVQNDIATSFSSILIPINAFLDAIIMTKTEVGAVKKQTDILAGAESWKKIISTAIDIGGIIHNVIIKALEVVSGSVLFIESTFRGLIAIIELVGKSIYYGITEAFYGAQRAATDVFEALALAAKGNFTEAGEALQKAITPGEGLSRYVEQVTNPLKKISIEANNARAGMSKIFSFEINTDAEAFKNKFLKAYDKAVTKTNDAVNSGGSGGRPAIRLPMSKVDISGDMQSIIKMMEKKAEEQKYYNGIEGKYNDLFFNSQIRSLEDYYDQKRALALSDYEINKRLYEEQIAFLSSQKINPNTNAKEYKQQQEQLLDIQIKQNKNETEYQLLVAETNSKFFKERIDKALSFKNLQRELNGLKEEEIMLEVEGGRNSFDANSEIIELRKERIKLLKEEIIELEARAKASPKDDGVKLSLAKANLELKKFEKDIDPIAKQINDTLASGFENFIVDITSGTKSIKDSFKDMFLDLDKMIMQMIAKDLGNQLMESLFGKQDSNGGVGGLLANLLGSKSSSSGGGIGGLVGQGMDFFGSLLSGAFATGGYAQSGGAYLVGEKGPELFFPGQSGYVANNTDSGRMAKGGSPIIVNFHGVTNMNEFKQSENQIAQRLMGAVQKGQRVS